MRKKQTLKKLPTIRENRALEIDFEKKLKAFTKECLNSFSYWLIAQVNKADPKNMIKLPDGKKQNLQTALKLEFEELISFWDEKSQIFAEKASKIHTNNILKFVNTKYKNAGFEIGMDNFTKQILKAQIEQQSTLIKSIPRHIMESCQSIFLNNLSSLDAQVIEESLVTLGGVSARRARTIARDQTHKALTNIIQTKAQAFGAEYYIWTTSNDERVSRGYGGHRQLNNRIYRYDTPSAVIDSYGNKGHCGERVNCLAKGQGIDFGYFPKRLFRFGVTDKFAVLILNGGIRWVVTRSHKVLTPFGWCNAELLKKGDKVISIVQKTSNISKIDFTHNKPIISKIFDFFDKALSISLCDALGFKRIGSAGDFDADIGLNENVDIVDMYSFLENGREFIISQALKDLNLSSSKKWIFAKKLLSCILSLESPHNFIVLSEFFASHRYISLFSDSSPLLEGAIFKSDKIGFTARASFISELIKSFGDDIPRNAKMFTHFEHAISSNIELFNLFYIYLYIVWWFRTKGFVSNPHSLKKPNDRSLASGEFLSDLRDTHSIDIKIVDRVEIINTNSHIYSLESDCGYYTIDKAIHKNCRCVPVSIFLEPTQKVKLVKDSKAGDYYEIVEK